MISLGFFFSIIKDITKDNFEEKKREMRLRKDAFMGDFRLTEDATFEGLGTDWEIYGFDGEWKPLRERMEEVHTIQSWEILDTEADKNIPRFDRFEDKPDGEKINRIVYGHWEKE